MTRAWSLLLASALSFGCSVDALEQAAFEPTTNDCTTDDQCGTGTCDATLGMCKAEQGQFSKILFEVTPPADADQYGGLAFIVPWDVDGKGGSLDLALGVVSKVTGTVQPQKADYQTCAVTYGASNTSTKAPVKVTFTSTTTILGLSAPHFTAKTSYNDKTEQYEFEAWLPPDEYDVYIEPLAEATPGSCPVVPQLVRGVKVDAGDVKADIPLQAPKLLVVDVVMPNASVTEDPTALTGWKIDVIDPTTGLVLSAPAELIQVKDPSDTQNKHYQANVEYSEATGENAGAGKELVRLRPPEGQDKPTLVLERAALELFTPGQAKIEAQKQLWPDPVTLLSLALYGGPNDEPFKQTATARFVSTKLEFDTSGGQTQTGLAFFEKSVEVVNGVAEDVKLLPGEYDVFVAAPAASGFATTRAKLTVGAKPNPQGGKSITLELVSDVGGNVLIPSGEKPAVGATVQAVASPVLPTPFEIAVGAVPYSPKASSGIVGESGQFSLEADPGVFDFSIRTAENTGFAWMVRPNVEVQAGVHDLGAMTLPLPVVYQGLVTVPGETAPSPVPGTLIRAFIYLNESGYTEDRAGAKSVVQIAEARADSTGKFRLLLPANLN